MSNLDQTVRSVDSIGHTPFFLVDESRIEDSVREIRTALARHWENNLLSFSVKTNSLPCVLEVLNRLHVWAEVVSEHEYDVVSSIGFAHSSCICNGPAKSRRFLEMALEHGAVLHLDDLHEVRSVLDLAKGRQVSFGVRVNATEDDFPAEPLCGAEGSRFGLSVRDGDFLRLVELLKLNPFARLTSLHLHCNTRGRCKEGFEWLSAFFARLVKDYHLSDIDTFDIGGSFGHDFDHPGDGEGRWPSWNQYFSVISGVLRQEGFSPNRLRLVVEPGSGLISNAADYYATVLGSRVIGGRRYMQMDGSRIHVDPHFTRASFCGGIEVAVSSGENPEENVAALFGSTCLEKDRVGFGGTLFSCAKGDRIVFRKTGAYTYGLSPHLFINSVPDVWFRRKEGSLVLANSREDT